MKRTLPTARLRGDRSGAEETFQVVPAVTVIIVCVGAVLSAVHAASEAGAGRAAVERAGLQAELFLDGLRADPAISDGRGAVSAALASAVSNGSLNLSFAPTTARLASLSWFPNGTEIFLLGNLGTLGGRFVLRAQPVPVLLEGGAVRPGLLRVGVEIR